MPSRDVAGVVLLTQLEAPRRRAEIGADAGGMDEALRPIDDADIGERHDGPDAGRGHQPLHRLVLARHADAMAGEDGDLAADGLPGCQQGLGRGLQRPRYSHPGDPHGAPTARKL
mgnify:CR=1 FL=1